ncbi:c-type cytochrome [Microvirga sp. M2]|uniref:c-type cytochrome n=1 Tax=Microvirga sp. M2 TaxID=3073270 RepID=UPI0039C0DEBC
MFGLAVPAGALLATLAWSSPAEVSAARGHMIVVGGGPGGAGAACFSCHGLQGQGDAGGAFPRLAGLDRIYLARQLDDYASGARPNPAMSPIAQQLTAGDRQSTALYYAELSAPAAVEPSSAADGRLVQWGAMLYAQGSAERGIQACANCHGPAASGLNRVYPPLLGQPASYVDAQLRLWRDGVRHNDIYDVMGTVARRMTDEDIRAAALYVAGISP